MSFFFFFSFRCSKVRDDLVFSHSWSSHFLIWSVALSEKRIWPLIFIKKEPQDRKDISLVTADFVPFKTEGSSKIRTFSQCTLTLMNHACSHFYVYPFYTAIKKIVWIQRHRKQCALLLHIFFQNDCIFIEQKYNLLKNKYICQVQYCSIFNLFWFFPSSQKRIHWRIIEGVLEMPPAQILSFSCSSGQKFNQIIG